jgi:tRNA-2-methylthio-N6-dimethylallyladenosine synthase
MSGRARDGRLVHFAVGARRAGGDKSTPGPPDGVRPGDVVHTMITYAAPHHLNADGPLVSHRRTRAGDLWHADQARRGSSVMLGLPAIGAPA